MNGWHYILQLAAAVALLLWSVRMVRTGVERAWTPLLKRAIRAAGNRLLPSALAGCAVAVALQSSTAAALLAAGFATTGLLGGGAAVAAALGADLGSAIVVKALSFDTGFLPPVLILCGAVLFLRFEGRMVRQTGRILLGIAFVLLSLSMIGEATAPLRDSRALPAVVGFLASDPVTAFVAAAAFAWLVHSTVASMLLIVSLAAAGLLDWQAGHALVMGVNAGGGAIAFWLAREQSAAARRMTSANLVFRCVGSVSALVALQWVAMPVWLGADDATRLVNLHLAFNAALLLACLPFAPLADRLARRVLPDRPAEASQEALLPPTALDPSVVGSPRLALASVTREVLRMGSILEAMLQPAMQALESGASAEIERIRGLDAAINRAHMEIKLFMAQVARNEMPAGERERGALLTEYAINLEHAGDLVAKTMMGLAREKAARDLEFSPAGWREMTDLHARVVANLQLAMNVLVSGDAESARMLVAEKVRMRELERESQSRHLERLRAGQARSIETSNMHLEIVRALKELNSLMATVAYPILAETGELLDSRLKAG